MGLPRPTIGSCKMARSKRVEYLRCGLRAEVRTCEFRFKSIKNSNSSHSGCGNTTATNNVGATLGLEVVNYTFRDLAHDLGLPFEKIQKNASKTNIYDFLTDLNLMRAALRPRVVVGSRL